MSMQWGTQSKPHGAVWLVLLVGTLTVIHMWSHAAMPYEDRPDRAVAAVAADPHPPSQDHHCEQAHTAACVPPTIWTPPAPAAGELAGAVPPLPAPPVLGRPGRAPPAGYRARSVLTNTLEVCRC